MKEKDLRHQVVDELRLRKELAELLSPNRFDNTDLVWVLSAPGTPLTTREQGLYAGRELNLELIIMGTLIMRRVAASKLGISHHDVTKTDIINHGPMLLYNGEDSSNGEPQNEHMREFLKPSYCPLPKENTVIRDLDEIYTPGQVKDLIKFLKEKPDITKIAVVALAAHSRRVARYIQKYKKEFPKTVSFIEACVPETEVPVGSVLKEIRKIVKYEQKGDLSEIPAF